MKERVILKVFNYYIFGLGLEQKFKSLKGHGN